MYPDKFPAAYSSCRLCISALRALPEKAAREAVKNVSFENVYGFQQELTTSYEKVIKCVSDMQASPILPASLIPYLLNDFTRAFISLR
jgi:hypothetical protein